MRSTSTRKVFSYLCDGEVQTYIDDDGEEEYVEGTYNQERLLQHQDLIEVIVNLLIRREGAQRITWKQFKCQRCHHYIANVLCNQ